MTFFWKLDPYKSKWSILAKAYSIVRDRQTQGKLALNEFLAVNAPYVGVIEPKQYLLFLGWTLETAEDGQNILVRQFVPDLNKFDKYNPNTNLSVGDIILHCYEQGYITEEVWLNAASDTMHNIIALSVPGEATEGVIKYSTAAQGFDITATAAVRPDNFGSHNGNVDEQIIVASDGNEIAQFHGTTTTANATQAFGPMVPDVLPLGVSHTGLNN